MPVIANYNSIKDLRDYVTRFEDLSYNKKLQAMKKDIFEVFIGRNSVLRSERNRVALHYLITNQEYRYSSREDGDFIKLLISLKIAKESTAHLTVIPDENLGVVASIAKQANIL